MSRLLMLMLLFDMMTVAICAQSSPSPLITPENAHQLYVQQAFDDIPIDAQILFSPDDRYILADGDPLRLWDTTTGELVHQFPNTDADTIITEFNHQQNLDFSPDVQTYISTVWNTIFWYDTQTGEQLDQHNLDVYRTIEQARFNPTGTHIITISPGDMWPEKVIHWWNTTTWSVDMTIQSVRAAVISPDARYVAYGLDNEIWLFDTLTGENRPFVLTYRAIITHLNFSRDSQFLYSDTEGEVSKWWDVQRGEFITTDVYIGTRNQPLELTSFRTDDALVYCLIDVRTQESIFTFTEHIGNITDTRFNHAGTQIVTQGLDGTIRLWGVAD